jgi:hypothetical protein
MYTIANDLLINKLGILEEIRLNELFKNWETYSKGISQIEIDRYFEN